MVEETDEENCLAYDGALLIKDAKKSVQACKVKFHVQTPD